MALLLFLILPISTVILLFINDSRKRRNLILNIVLVINTLLYSYPVVSAYLNTPPGGNMWSENGPGAILWLYMIILPICVVVQIGIMVLKVFFKEKK